MGDPSVLNILSAAQGKDSILVRTQRHL